MKKLLVLSALISFTMFTSCNKEEVVDAYVPLEESVTENNEQEEDNIVLVGQADFSIDNDDNTVWESGDLLLTNKSVNAVAYHWDFGNGDTSTEANPSYSNYKMHGPFTITLTVTDAQGDIHQASHEVVVLCIFGGPTHQF